MSHFVEALVCLLLLLGVGGQFPYAYITVTLILILELKQLWTILGIFFASLHPSKKSLVAKRNWWVSDGYITCTLWSFHTFDNCNIWTKHYQDKECVTWIWPLICTHLTFSLPGQCPDNVCNDSSIVTVQEKTLTLPVSFKPKGGWG